VQYFCFFPWFFDFKLTLYNKIPKHEGKSIKHIFTQLLHEGYFCTHNYIINYLFCIRNDCIALFLTCKLRICFCTNRNTDTENGNNNTVTYSYNIFSTKNRQETLTRLHNSSVSSYYDNTTGYPVYPELTNNTQ
jgi:hypothetical protein